MLAKYGQSEWWVGLVCLLRCFGISQLYQVKYSIPVYSYWGSNKRQVVHVYNRVLYLTAGCFGAKLWAMSSSCRVTSLQATPLTDPYFYLRDHSLQNPTKAKVHCEHGFSSLRLAMNIYLKVSFHRMFHPTHVLMLYQRNVNILVRKPFDGHLISYWWINLTLTTYLSKICKLSPLFHICRSQAQHQRQQLGKGEDIQV